MKRHEPAIPEMGTPLMQLTMRSRVIGESPRPEVMSTVRRRASREIFGETDRRPSD